MSTSTPSEDSSAESTDQQPEVNEEELEIDLDEEMEERLEELNIKVSQLDEQISVAKEISEQLQTLKTNADAQESALSVTIERITEVLSSARDDGKQTRTLAQEAEELRETISSKEEKLVSLTAETSDLKERIESLLPSATAAGLAESFGLRKSQHYWRRVFWASVSILSILALVCCGIYWAINFSTMLQSSTAPQWESIAIQIVGRVPIVLPLIWLAIYAGRHHREANRLEEDYAYKEVLSTSFEGYRREMEAVESTEASGPLSTLCNNVLKSLSDSPGRLYDNTERDITPLNSVVEALNKIDLKKFMAQTGLDQTQAQKAITTILEQFVQK